jgi:steroid delta-isomerase-like uncharacterized protein
MTTVNTTQQIKGLFRRWFNEVWNQGKYEVANEIVAEDMIVHGASGQPLGHGREGIVSLVRLWRTAFPDGQMTIGDLLAERDMGVARVIWQGTHTAPFYNIPPTGRRVTVVGLGFDRVRDGQFVESWGDTDLLGLLQQVGAVQAFINREAYRWPPISQEQIVASTLSTPPSTVPSSASPGENRELARRFFETLNGWNIDALREVVDTANYIEHNPFLGPLTFDQAIQIYSLTHQAVPDLHITLDSAVQITEGDRIASRGTLRGTHTAVELFGARPDGRVVEWTGNDILRIAQGKIVERWVCADIFRLMRTLGVSALQQVGLPVT